MLWSSSLVVLVGVLMAATPADQRAIRAVRVAQNNAIAAGDLDRVASFWTEDVTVRRALGQPLAGRTAARQALEPPATPGSRLVYQRVTKDVEVSPKWPLAFETGTWEGHLGTIAGPTMIGGRYSAQWVKRGDRWLIRSEVFVALTCSGVGCESAARLLNDPIGILVFVGDDLMGAYGCTNLWPHVYGDALVEPTYVMPPSGRYTVDHYETLQISVNAEPETIHRVYRLLAQRFHPDNTDTGNAARFRELTEAYEVLSDPERRAKYDVVHQQFWRERWKAVEATNGDVDFRTEQIARLTLLELLYTRRRTEPQQPSMSILDVEALTGRPREHLQFSIWFLTQKRFIQRGDDSGLTITADGAEYLENNIDGTAQSRLLRAGND